jgi:hypothetical protein
MPEAVQASSEVGETKVEALKVRAPEVDSIYWVRCSGCGTEVRAWLNEHGRPEIPPEWRGVSPSCCERSEIYACCGRCLQLCGVALFRTHDTKELLVRSVLLDPTEELEDQLIDCESAVGRSPPCYSKAERAFIEAAAEQWFENAVPLDTEQEEKIRELWQRLEQEARNG